METLFRIPDKDGKDVDFILNDVQRELDDTLTGRDVIPKARQLGVSTYFLGRYLAACLASRNTRAVVISHDKESTQRMLIKVHYMLANIRGPKAIIKNASKNELTFPKTNSMFYIGTAGSRKFGRGDTISHLHCSEVAFWENATDLLTGLFQAVPPSSGEIALESTGNGVGNMYHKRCMRSSKGLGRYRLHFFDWLRFPEYNLSVTKEEAFDIMNSLDPQLEEDIYVEKYHLTPGQIKFRRDKLEELDFDLSKFKQEYPVTLDECFQATGKSIFQFIDYKVTDDWIMRNRKLHILGDHPIKDVNYLVGVDTGAGVGGDKSVVEIYELESLEQIAEWVDDRTEPDDFGKIVEDLCRRFNEAYVTVENNNHGIMVTQHLRKNYIRGKIYTRPRAKGSRDEVGKLASVGMRTTVTSKPLIIGKFRRLLKTDIIIHSSYLYGELQTFIENEVGGLEAEAGCNDDTVIASAMCMVGVEKACLQLPEEKVVKEVPWSEDPRNPFLVDAILKELRLGGDNIPINKGLYLERGDTRIL